MRERRAPRARTTTSWCRARAIGLAVLPYPQPPAGLTKEHIRVALTAQGVRYAVLAQFFSSVPFFLISRVPRDFAVPGFLSLV